MSQTSEDVIEALELLKYPKVESLVDNGRPRNLSTIEFSSIVNWLSGELDAMLNHDHTVNKINNESEVDALKIELNSLLRELQSPFTGSSLDDEITRMAIIHYLCGELIAARILFVNKPDDGGMKIDMHESETAKDLKTSMIILGIGKPPANVQSSQLFAKMKDKINEKLKTSTLPQEEPLILNTGTQLVPKEWESLDKINKAFYDDYSVRRKTLITRCDCTIGSFKWKEGDKTGDSNLCQRIDESYDKLRLILDPKPTIDLAHALAARESGCYELLNSVVSKSHQICDIETPKTKGMANVGKQQRISLQKFLIGHVPDRGGRPNEQPPPPQETFQVQQVQRQQPRGGGHSRGRGDHHSQSQHHKQPHQQQYQQRDQQRDQPHRGHGGQYQSRDSHSQSYHQPNQKQQYYGEKNYHSSYQSRDQYQETYQSDQPHQGYDNHRGGHRGSRNVRGGRGGGRVQGVGWNQGYQRY